MQIGLIGAGNVGQALGAGLIAHGHQVMLGTRDPQSDKVQQWVRQTGSGAQVGTFAEVGAFGELLVLVTSWEGTQNALQLMGPEQSAGKVVIDATNPIGFGPQGLHLTVGFDSSAGELVQQWLPQAHVVKALNSVGVELMTHPRSLSDTPDAFICGNDAGAKATVAQLLTTFGWNIVDTGDISKSRLLEPLALLWVDYFLANKTLNHAFKLIR